MTSIKSRTGTVIVLGLGPSGLFLVRQLSKLTKKIYAIGRLDDVGMYSKHICKENRYYISSVSDLISVLKEITIRANERPTLFLSSDQYLTLLLSEDVNWDEYVNIVGSEISVLRLINDKQTITDFCKSHDILIPRSYALQDFRGLEYPIIIKPNEKKLNPKKDPIGKFKVCHTKEEYECLLTELLAGNINPNEYHAQTYITGNNDQQYSVGGYYHDGEPLAEVVVNQIKQYPQGISALVVTTNDSNSQMVQDIAHKFVKELRYSGFLEAEFKIDQSTNTPYLLDINPRPWGWVSVLGSAFDDFHVVFENKKAKMPGHPVLWQSKIRRLMSFRNKNNSTRKLNESAYVKAYDIYDPEDKRPSKMIYVMAIKKLFKR